MQQVIDGTTTMFQYLYDAEGNRVAKGTITSFSCDNSINQSTGRPNNGFLATAAFVLGPRGEQMTEMTNNSGTWQWAHTNVDAAGLSATYDADPTGQTEGPVYFHLFDWLGTRRQQTDYAGNPVINFTSLPFGNGLAPIAVSTTDVADSTEHHFTGKERDTESGNDYFGARYYASAMGRFLSADDGTDQDPSNPQSWNLYSYVRNNPATRTDSDGRSVNVCTNDASGNQHCTLLSNDQYTAAQQGNGGLNVPTLDQVGSNGNGSGQFNATNITDSNGNSVGTATYVSDGGADYYANANGYQQLSNTSQVVKAGTVAYAGVYGAVGVAIAGLPAAAAAYRSFCSGLRLRPRLLLSSLWLKAFIRKRMRFPEELPVRFEMKSRLASLSMEGIGSRRVKQLTV
jgi:RHS repeat-associated protein